MEKPSDLTNTLKFTPDQSIDLSPDKLLKIINNLPGLVYCVRNDDSWTIEFISQGNENLHGCSIKQPIDSSFFHCQNRIHPEDLPHIRKFVDLALDAHKPFQIVFRAKTASGDYKWLYERGSGVYDETGNLIYIVGFAIDFTQRKQAEERLHQEIYRLRSSVLENSGFRSLVGKSIAMQSVYDFIIKSAATDSNVIIYGESGSGKELVAREIHACSKRHQANIVTVNCGAIPESLLEAEFFGYRKGSFTGAVADKEGFIAAANGGTLFLDEVGEISQAMQVKLLRVLQSKEYMPLGSNKPEKVDFRLISATNKDMQTEVKNGNIRKDFYYRIHVLAVNLPPLRNRKEDIPLLVHHFINLKTSGKSAPVFSDKDMIKFLKYDWPGNVRELENAVERHLAMIETDFLSIENFSQQNNDQPINFTSMPDEQSLPKMVEALEKRVIFQTLKKCLWNRSQTAAALGVDRKTLYNKIKAYHLDKLKAQ
jgi:PAS domain S-box-containing protein